MDARNIYLKLNNIYTTDDVKKIYIDNGMNPLSANYFSKRMIDDKKSYKIQNGLFFKKDTNFSSVDIVSFFKGKNEEEFEIITPSLFNEMDLTNAIFNKNIVFTKSSFYNNNESLFKFIKSKIENLEVVIITSKWRSTPSLKLHAKVYVCKFTNLNEEDYFKNAHNLIKDIKKENLFKIFESLKLNHSTSASISEIYYGGKND